MNSKILIIGSNGLLGQKVVDCFRNGFEIVTAGLEPEPFVSHGLPYFQVDITDRQAVSHLMNQVRPDVVYNAAAYTQVDRAEDEKELCYAVNVTGVENLATLCAEKGAKLIHISTDYVFDGKKGNYTEEDSPNPLGFYGYTKFLGEIAVRESGCSYIIARTAVLFGYGEKIQPNFAMWAVDSLLRNKKIRVVDDQIGNPTIAENLARATRDLIDLNATGLFHVAGREALSRYHFTVRIAQIFGFDETLISRITSKDFPQKAPRPMNASLNVKKVLDMGIRLFSINESLRLLKNVLFNAGYLQK